MSNWSKGLQEQTRRGVYPGAIMKDENQNFGFYSKNGERVVIRGIKEGGFPPMPSEEIIATFGSVNEMIDAGWVID